MPDALGEGGVLLPLRAAGAHGGQFQQRARVGGPLHVRLHAHEQLHEAEKLLPHGAARLFAVALRVLGRAFQKFLRRLAHGLRQQQRAQMFRHLAGEHLGVQPPSQQFVDLQKRAAGVARKQRGGEIKEELAPRRAQHIAREGEVHLPVRVGKADVEDAEGVAHRAFGGAGDLVQGLFRGRAADAAQHHHHALDHGLHAQTPKIEALAAGEDGGGEPLRLGGGEDEHGVGRRLFQRFQKRVERAGGEHVYLVDDVDLVFGHRRGVLDLFAQIADLVHAVVGGGVDLDDVHAVFLLQLQAHIAFSAGVAVHGMQAVDGAGKHLGRGGLARAARAAEQIGVGHAPGLHLMAQRFYHGVLPDDLRKRLRPPCAVQCLIAHIDLRKNGLPC